jgi:hypothetical protein
MAKHAQGKANLASLHRHRQQLPHRPGSGADRHHAPDRRLGQPWLKPLDAASISLCHVHRSVAFRPIYTLPRSAMLTRPTALLLNHIPRSSRSREDKVKLRTV